MPRKPISKGERYGDFEPVGRKALPDGRLRFKARCVQCGKVAEFAESTLRAKPDCSRCRRLRDGGRVADGELPEGVADGLATFKADAPDILDMLESLEGAPGAAFSKSAIRMLIALIPEAEVAYRMRPSQQQAYALNSFLTQVRELQQDLDERAAQADMAGDLMDKVMRPKFSEIVRLLADFHYSLDKMVTPYVDKRRRGRIRRGMQDAVKDIGSKLDVVYREIEEGLMGRLR